LRGERYLAAVRVDEKGLEDAGHQPPEVVRECDL
jgi:hypothetical protein